MRPSPGWTLLELAVALGIAAILAAWAASAYSGYVVRSRVLKAQAALDSLAASMTAYYQDNRTFTDSTGSCPTAPPTNVQGFAFSCTATPTSFRWVASNDGTEGLGAPGSYRFSVDQDGNRSTLAFAGHAVALPCWIVRHGGHC